MVPTNAAMHSQLVLKLAETYQICNKFGGQIWGKDSKIICA